MMPDPDAAPERPEPASAPDVLPAAEHRAVDAAVAGVAGLLVGRALFGRAGGLVAGLAAVGAGLLAKRRPELRRKEPDAAPLNGSGPVAVVPSEPVTQVRLETGVGTVDDGWAVLADRSLPAMTGLGFVPPAAAVDEAETLEAAGGVAMPESGPEPQSAAGRAAAVPDDAGAFAEMPALFGNAPPVAGVPAAEPVILSPAERTKAAEGPVVFDDGPAPVEVNILPVADLVSLADEALEKEVFPEEHAVPGRPKSPPVPAAHLFGLLEEFPAEFAAYKEEQEAGPRDGFLLIPDQTAATAPAESVPPIHSVVAALSESLAATAAATAAQKDADAPEGEVKVAEEPATAAAAAESTIPAEPPAVTAAADAEPVAATPEVALVSPTAAVAEVPERIEPAPPAAATPPAGASFRLWTTPVTAPAMPSPPAVPDVAARAPDPVAAVPPLPFQPPVLPPAPAAPSAVTVPVHPSAPTVATVPIHSQAPLAATVPIRLPVPPAPGAPVPDPEEIWRQAAAELNALRHAPGRPLPSAPVLPEGLLPGAPAFPVLPELPGMPPPFVVTQAADPDSPPWMKPPSAEENPEAERIEQDPSRHKAFLPTIKLSMPQSPQPLAARRPIPLPVENAPAPAPGAAPVARPGDRAEPVPATLPAAIPEQARNPDALVSDLPPAAPAIHGVASVPLAPIAPIPVVAGVSNVAAALTPPAPFTAAAPMPPPGEGEKLFVPRASSRRHTPESYRRRTFPAVRLTILVVIIAAALAVAYKSQLMELWEKKILGRPAGGTREKILPKSPGAKGMPGEASDVKIAPDEAVPADPAPPSPPVTPAAKDVAPEVPAPAAPPPAPPPPPAPAPAAPANSAPETVPTAPDTPGVPTSTGASAAPVAATIAPSPPAVVPSDDPLPVSENGARELISRLLRATTPAGVTPYIYDAVRLAPAVESYFSGGKVVPVASSESILERAEKSAVTGRTVWLFRVTTDNVPRGFPLGVEDTPDGLRADWELFTQCRDGVLKTFLTDTSAPPGVYYTALMRKHIFPDMLPDKDHTKYFAFDVSSPSLGDNSFNVFIPKSTPLAARADNLYKFSVPYGPVLELTHKDGHVEITGIVRENWRVSSRGGSR